MVEKSECPSCGSKVFVGTKPRVGQRVKCPSCSSELEVVWLDPVELDWPYDEDEFDEDDESDYNEEPY
jgi:lysine biosynthesis protein LysW